MLAFKSPAQRLMCFWTSPPGQVWSVLACRHRAAVLRWPGHPDAVGVRPARVDHPRIQGHLGTQAEGQKPFLSKLDWSSVVLPWKQALQVNLPQFSNDITFHPIRRAAAVTLGCCVTSTTPCGQITESQRPLSLWSSSSEPFGTMWTDHQVLELPWCIAGEASTRVSFPSSAVRAWPGSLCISAGVGRTGTFIALDRVLQQLDSKGTIDLYGIVFDLRLHRQHMVQTEVGHPSVLTIHAKSELWIRNCWRLCFSVSTPSCISASGMSWEPASIAASRRTLCTPSTRTSTPSCAAVSPTLEPRIRGGGSHTTCSRSNATDLTVDSCHLKKRKS